MALNPKTLSWQKIGRFDYLVYFITLPLAPKCVALFVECTVKPNERGLERVSRISLVVVDPDFATRL